MAKATLTFEDSEDGEVLVDVDFDPPVDHEAEEPLETLSEAQKAALSVVVKLFPEDAEGINWHPK